MLCFQLKLEPQKIVTISHAFPTFCLLEKTDFITIVPKRIAEQLAKRFNLTFQNLPFKVPKIKISQVWPRYLDNDPGLCWLRNVIKQIP